MMQEKKPKEEIIAFIADIVPDFHEQYETYVAQQKPLITTKYLENRQ